MAGYKCVNFYDLCRLCSSPSSSVQIFSSADLQKKIAECLSITLNEKDKLPKNICLSCKDYVDTFCDFKKACSNTEKMLLGCINTSKLRNGGQVYIRDETPIKKVLKPIQNPSPTKIVPILTATPTKQMKKNIITSSAQNQPDFLSSIMQASGIQGEEIGENASITLTQQNIQQPSNSIPMLPQYTLTLDGNTLKSGQIQYKIENAGNMLSQFHATTGSKNFQDIQNQQVTLNQVDEFLKLKQKPSLIVKNDSNPSLTLAAAANNNAGDEPKDKKPKFNLILQTTPQKQPKQQPQIVNSPQAKAFTSPNKAQILNFEKIMPGTNQQKSQMVVPIMVRTTNDGGRNTISTGSDAASQLFSQALSMSALANQSVDNKGQQQPIFVQMKIQPNADGQLTLTPATNTTATQQIQLALSPQQLQQLNFLPQLHHQQQQQITVQQPPQTQLSIPMQPQVHVQPAVTTTVQETQTQTNMESNEKADEVVMADEDFNDTYDDDFYPVEEGEEEEEQNESLLNNSQEKTQRTSSASGKKSNGGNKKNAKNLKQSKLKSKVDNSLTELQSVNIEHSEMATKQLNQLTNFNNKKTETESAVKCNDINLTVCEVCKKIFKRKEFLLQHLKSHIGLRPFKCHEAQCNKSFSRKEHLLRHISSHTGTKEFICNVCNKLFSRKDNLNKHRRIHPEINQQNSKQKSIKTETSPIDIKHMNAVEEDVKDNIKTKPATLSPHSKKIKINKTEVKEEAIKTLTVQNQFITTSQTQQQQQAQQQPKLVQVIQPSQMPIKSETQSQQIILSMSQAQAMFSNKSGIYTFPATTNYILNSNGTFMATSSNDIANLKFETQ